MSDLRVIQADFANWRPVTGRKVLQLIFEIDISQTGEVLRRLGTPTPGESKWCAIALLEPKIVHEELVDKKPGELTPCDKHGIPLPAKTSKKFADMPLSQQAGIRCDDQVFQEYMGVMNAADAARLVRARCEIETRSELARNEHAAAAWQKIEAQYQSWLTDRKYAQVAR